MSIKGGPYGWFRAALGRGDLAAVRAAAAELGHRVNLVDALAIVLLMAAREDDAYERAATRWLARLVWERPAVGLEDLREALAALELLPRDPAAAKHALTAFCERQGLTRVVGLLS